MTIRFETTLKRWPLFDDRQHWKVIASTGHWKFFPADEKADLKMEVAEFQMDVRATLGQPIDEIDRNLAHREAEEITKSAFNEHPV